MKSLFLTSAFYTASSILVKGVSFLLVLWLASFLSVEDYGDFGFLYALHQGIVVFSIAGINESTVGFLAKNKSDDERNRLLSNANYAILPSSIIVFFVLLIFYFASLKSSNPNLLLSCFVLTVLSGLMLAFSTLQSQLNRLREDHVGSLIFLSVPALFIFLGGSVAVYYFEIGQYFFVGSSIAILACLVTVLSLIRKIRIPIRNGEYAKKIIWGLFPYFLIAVLGWINGYGNNFIINFFFDKPEIAAFTFIYTFSGVMLVISNALNQVWAPRFYNSYNHTAFEELEKSNHKFYGILAFSLGLAASVMVLLYPTIISVIGGNTVAYEHMRFELFLVLTSFVIYTPIWHCRIHIYARSKGKQLMKLTIISSILGLLSTLAFISLLGEDGIYIGFFSLTAISLIVIVLFARRNLNTHLNWWGVALGTLLVTIIFGLSYLKVPELFSILVIVIAIVGVAVYGYRSRTELSINE